ncbi:MAG: hypothetical protein JKX69_06590 [Rhodobacteraceae bacterium]|nr:hypothetical protein [Paracoccaceae bacterium]
MFHPPFRIGGSGQEHYRMSMSGVGLSAFYYRFEQPEEAVPGQWRVEARSGDFLVYALDFDMVIPGPNDGLIRACNGL